MATANETVLFKDSMTKDWQTNWFLDGKKATVEHRDGGLEFITDYTVDKRIDRAGFDSQHAVLWTKPEFEGDVRITYNYTKLPNCSWQKLIYVQAQGIGTEEYPKDIYAWREKRNVPVMSQYFNHMNLIGLSLRDEIRCKRYPWGDVVNNLEVESEILPRGENRGMEIGRDIRVLLEKREKSISLRMTDVETSEHAVDHTWDLTDEAVLKNRELKYVTKGRIGIRLMGGHKINFRDFKVEKL